MVNPPLLAWHAAPTPPRRRRRYGAPWTGSNFVHGIVVVGAMYALLNATSGIEQVIGFLGVLLGAGNAAGGYVVTERMLEMFKASGKKKA